MSSEVKWKVYVTSIGNITYVTYTCTKPLNIVSYSKPKYKWTEASKYLMYTTIQCSGQMFSRQKP